MVAHIYAVKHERGEFSNEVGWRFPYVGLIAVCYGNISVQRSITASCVPGGTCDSLSIRTETGSEDFCLEVNMVQHCALSEMHKQCSAIYHKDSKFSLFWLVAGLRHVPSSIDNSTFPSGESAIDRIFFRFSNGRVRDLLLIA